MAPNPVPPVPMEFVCAAYEPEAGAIAIESVGPNINAAGPLSLEPGLYKFKHNSVSGQPPSWFYGANSIFEIKAQTGKY